MKTYYKIIILLLPLLFLDGCATNPVTGKRDFMLMSEEQEIAMGRETDPQVIATYGLYQDNELQQFIKEKGHQMAAISHRPDLPFEFKIVDSPVVNAFAVPGGYVYFTRGIMAHFNNTAEFSGVLGHEIGHITARHSAKQYSKAQAANLGLGLGMIFSETVRQYGDVAGQGLQVLFLKFGRDAERQSDDLGVEYASEIGYDTYEMADFFVTLDRISGEEGDMLPSFMSTHPDPAERTTNVRKETEKWQKKLNLTDPEVSRNEYLRMIDGMIYGNDPRQGFVDNGNFYHPELRFYFDVPENWGVQNSPQQVRMAPQDGSAAMALRLAEGNSLEQAASSMMEGFGLQVDDTRTATVNGFPAMAVLASQSDDQGNQIKALFYFIQDQDMIYAMYGVTSAQDFGKYSSLFERTMQSFSRLNDSRYLNREPTRIRIREVKRTESLASSLKSFGMEENVLETLSILNGMNLSDEVTQGMLIKTFTNQESL